MTEGESSDSNPGPNAQNNENLSDDILERNEAAFSTEEHSDRFI